MRSILFCGNGMSAEVLKKLHGKYKIYVITEFPKDKGLEYADKVEVANAKNPEEALKAAIKLDAEGYKFEAVISLCWDCPLSVSLIAEHFNLFGVSPEIAKNSSIKSIRSKLFEDAGVPSPKYKCCGSLEEVKEVLSTSISLPIVFKPLALAGAKGVIYVDDINDVEKAYEFCTSCSNEKNVLVNEYIEGTEYSTEGLMVNGKLYMTGISERVFKYKEYRPHFVEAGDIMPVSLTDDEIENFRVVTEKAAKALSINNGIVKGDLIYTKNKEIRVFELTPRLGGPRFGTEMIPLSNGTNILEAAIQQALGEEINYEFLKPQFKKGMINRAIFPKPGIIKGIDGLDKIKQMKGFYDFKWFRYEPYKVGDEIKSPENMWGAIGYAIVTGENREDALKNADEIEKAIDIQTY